MTTRIRILLLAFGLLALAASVGMARHDAAAAASRTWPPSALVWWQAARSVGARPSAPRYSAVGILLAPAAIAAALAAGHVHIG